MRHFFHLTLWCIASALLLTVILHWTTEENFLIVQAFRYLMPWTLAILVPAALFSITLRYYGLFICLLLPVAYIAICYVPYYLPKRTVAKTSEQITVMSFNVWSENTNMEAVCYVVESEKPDMLFLQEISRLQLDQLVHHLRTSNKNHLVNVSFDSSLLLAFLSRFPFVEMTSPGTTRAKIQKVRVVSDNGAILVFNVHFDRGQRKQLNKDIEAFIKEQLTAIQGPTLLGGDLNTTSQTPIYQSLKATLNNVHDKAGWGLGFTYPARLMARYNLPLPAIVRIDHIFSSSHFEITEAKTLSQSGGSDHFPVLTRLLIKKTDY